MFEFISIKRHVADVLNIDLLTPIINRISDLVNIKDKKYSDTHCFNGEYNAKAEIGYEAYQKMYNFVRDEYEDGILVVNESTGDCTLCKPFLRKDDISGNHVVFKVELTKIMTVNPNEILKYKDNVFRQKGENQSSDE